MDVKIEESWKNVLQDEFNKKYFSSLVEFIKKEYQNNTIYPPGNLIFNAFNHCPFDALKVVIIGQDPYHGPGQAHGLCFSVKEGIQFPPSLKNIFKEIKNEVSGRINGMLLVLTFNKFYKTGKVLLIKFILKHIFPGFFNFYIHIQNLDDFFW